MKKIIPIFGALLLGACCGPPVEEDFGTIVSVQYLEGHWGFCETTIVTTTIASIPLCGHLTLRIGDKVVRIKDDCYTNWRFGQTLFRPRR